MRIVGWIAVVIALLAAMFAAWVRLAPVDPAGWNVDMAAPGFAPAARWAQFCPRPGERFAPTTADPAEILARLDAIALATPRTARLAGSPEEGRITWITRSAVWGFPDFTTAQMLADANGPRLCIVGRQGIGDYDWGVNAHRIQGWAQTLLGLNEAPDLREF